MPKRQRLSDNQEWLLANVRATSAQRAIRQIRRTRLTTAQSNELDQAVEFLKRDDVRIVINADMRKTHAGFRAPIIDGLLATKRLLNRFEIEQAQQVTTSPNMTSRIMEEFLLYGATPDIIPILALLSAAERPHYGALDFIGNPHALPFLGFYGPYRLRLKKEVVSRSTFTAGSLPLVPSTEVYVWEDIRGVLMRKFRNHKPPKFLFEYVNEGLEPTDAIRNLLYIEAQVLGGIDLAEDVDAIHYPISDHFTDLYPKLERLAAECNITLKPY